MRMLGDLAGRAMEVGPMQESETMMGGSAIGLALQSR